MNDREAQQFLAVLFARRQEVQADVEAIVALEADLRCAKKRLRDRRAGLERLMAEGEGGLPLFDRPQPAAEPESPPDGKAPSLARVATIVATCSTCGAHAGQECKPAGRGKGPDGKPAWWPRLDGVHHGRYAAALDVRRRQGITELSDDLLVAAWGGDWRDVGLMAIVPEGGDWDVLDPWLDRVHVALGLAAEEEPTVGGVARWLAADGGRTLSGLPLDDADLARLAEVVRAFRARVPAMADALAADLLQVDAQAEAQPLEEPSPAWCLKPLIDLVDPPDWPGPYEKGACLAAVDALARPLVDRPGVTRLGELAVLVVGSEPINLDELAVEREDGTREGLAEAEVRALRFALLSYREQDAAFAAACAASCIDPTASRAWFKVEFKTRKGKQPRRPFFLLATSKLRAAEHAERWGADVVSIAPHLGEPPEGALVQAIALEGYDDRHRAKAVEQEIDERIRKEHKRKPKAAPPAVAVV